MRIFRLHSWFSVMVAVGLQLLPLARVAPRALAAVSSPLAIILRWAGASAALLGGLHAVSGASTVITSPATAAGKVGVAFSYRITTGPDGANRFSAAPLPPGLAVNPPGKNGFIMGTPTEAGSWNVLLTASDNGLASRTTTKNLTITIAANATAPAITVQPQSQSILLGSTITLSVTANGTTPLFYQWRQNGSEVPGATSSSLTLASITASEAGSYDVVVNNSLGTITSTAATITVLLPPFFLSAPLSQTVNEGDSVEFSASVSGTPPITFQWQFNGAAIPGATNATLVLTDVHGGAAGDYNVRVSNAIGAGFSQTARLTVLLTPPTIQTQPPDQTVLAGGTVTISAPASGGLPLQYQWQFNGIDLPGATNAALVFTNVQPSATGDYRVRVSNSAATVFSAAMHLTVNLPLPLTLVNARLSGRTFTFNVHGTLGASFILWTSPDLLHWAPVQTNQVSAATFLFVDPDVTTDRTDFYRATAAP